MANVFVALFKGIVSFYYNSQKYCKHSDQVIIFCPCIIFHFGGFFLQEFMALECLKFQSWTFRKKFNKICFTLWVKKGWFTKLTLPLFEPLLQGLINWPYLINFFSSKHRSFCCLTNNPYPLFGIGHYYIFDN